MSLDTLDTYWSQYAPQCQQMGKTEVVGAYKCTKIQENTIILFLFGYNVLSIFLFSGHTEIIMKVWSLTWMTW